MGDTQKLTPDEQVRSAFEAYEDGTDFTVAVEEEFAILDPAHARAQRTASRSFRRRRRERPSRSTSSAS